MSKPTPPHHTPTEPATAPQASRPGLLQTLARMDAVEWGLVGMHVAAVAGALYYGLSWSAFWVALVSYLVRMFGVSAGYHRYFAHRSFKTGRIFQFLLAVVAISNVQKGVLWWASNHRFHHQHSDTELDPHSARHGGLWWAHAGWILTHRYDRTNPDRVRDWTGYPELQWLNRHYLVPPLVIAAVFVMVAGIWGLVWGVLVPTVLTMHATFAINSLAHWKGSRRFATTDDSTNNWFVAIVTLGDGFHNNHHHYPRSARHGFMWWELDVVWIVLRMLAAAGVVWDLHEPTPAALRERRIDNT